MKIKRPSADELLIVDSGFSVQVWGVLMLLLSTLALAVILPQQGLTESTRIPLVMSGAFWVAGLLAAVFSRHRLTYALDRKSNSVSFRFPVLMGARVARVGARLSDVVAVVRSSGTEYSDEIGRFYQGHSFALKLRDGSLLDASMRSSDRKEIARVAEAIAEFCGVKIEEA
jgi:hypothetical protein